MLKRLFYIVLFIVISHPLFSQNYNIKNYTVEDGLLHSFVNDIVQDNNGNIWLATGGGLSMFNGVEFKNYTTKDGLNYPRLLSVDVDNENNIWIGTLVGLNIFDGDSIYSLKSSKEKILAIEKSNDGKMWVLSNKGLKKIAFNKGKFKIKKINFDFGYNTDVNIFQDTKWNNFLIETKNNELYIGLNNKVFVRKNNKISTISINDSTEILSACELNNNKILFGTNKGLFIKTGNTFVPANNSHVNNYKIFKIKQKNNKIWMLASNNNITNSKIYLLSINLNEKIYFRKISISNGLLNNPTSLFIDHENNIWTGSSGGLNVLKGESFVNYTTQNGLIGNKIWGIYNGEKYGIWVGTINQGLSIIYNDTILNFDSKNGLPDNYIGSIYKFKDNIFFIGGGRKGLCTATFDTINKTCKFKQLRIPLNKGRTRIDDIIKDKNNTFWICSNKGLYFTNDGKNFIHKKLFKNDTNQVMVQKILLASNSKLYIATKKRGLFIIDKNKITNKFNNDSLKIGIISLCEDINKNIWAASQYKGVINLSDKQNKWITDKNGLSSELIYILQADRNGNIWVGSNLGLDKIDADKYDKSKKIIIRHYGINDGLQAMEMNLNGSFEDQFENLWFATNNGLLKYDYHYDISNRIPPIISILDIKIHSKKVNWLQYCDSLKGWNKLPIYPVLPYYQNHITFNFIGISYKNPKEIRYSWKLEGFDKDWVPSSKNRQVIYSNLPPGNYTFMLKSSNNDGVWNKKILKFSFKITPPFWVTWWFITLMIILIIFIIYLIIIARTRSLKKRQIELQKIVFQRTKEIFKQKEEIKQQRDTVAKQKQRIEQIHFRLSDSIDYAKRIQNSILPDTGILKKQFLDYLLIFMPKDKVSGDFYWWTQVNDETIIAAADCTGHGVPGAFMSMLGISFLHEIVDKEKITNPGLILDLLRKNVIEALSQTGDYNEPKDGMDISIVSINNKTNVLKYAGANNPLYLIKNEKLNIKDESSNTIKLIDNSRLRIQNSKLLYEIKPDKMPISIYIKMENFTTNEIELNKGDYIYLFSDGFADQFGKSNNKKFGYKAFKKMIIDNANKPMIEQKKVFIKTLEDWKKDNEQIDDILIIGIRI